MTETAVLELPTDSPFAPDIQTAAAALQEAPAAPPGASSSSSSSSSSESPAPAAPAGASSSSSSSSSSESPAPAAAGRKRANAKPWSEQRIRKAPRKAVREYIRQLEAERASAPPPSSASSSSSAKAPDAPPAEAIAVDPAALIEPLARSFKGVTALAASALGDVWQFSDKECRELAEAWAPVAAQYAGAFAQHSPLIVAGLTTAYMVAPRVKKMREEARLAAAEAARSQIRPVVDGPSWRDGVRE